MTTIDAIPGVRRLWELTLGRPDVTIGLVEGLPDRTHPCFSGADLTYLRPRWLPRDDEPMPQLRQHATFVASVLFGQHDGPVPGIAPRCRGLILPALQNETTLLDPINAARSVDLLVEEGADIIHFAAGHPTRSDDTDPIFKRAIRNAYESGVLVVAPAGNDHGECDIIPAILPEVLAVGAMDHDGVMFRYSDWGPPYRGHGIVAPGGFLLAAEPGGGTVEHKGTSVAAPVVSGVAALLESLRRDGGGLRDPLAVRAALLSSARRCEPGQAHGDPDRCLDGVLDIEAATAHATRRGHVTTSSARTSAGRRAPLVYALGSLGVDFGTQAQRDRVSAALDPADPNDPVALAAHLRARPDDAPSLIWTLTHHGGPSYALAPTSAYSDEVYELFTLLLSGQAAPPGDDDFVERISVPGRLSGRTVRLLSGQSVPVLDVRHRRGIYGWATEHLVETAAGTLPDGNDSPAVHDALRDFLARVYSGPNVGGVTARARALNFAATNPYQAARAISAANAAGLVLESIRAESSNFCRIGSICQDVVLRFHDPDDEHRSARAWRFTIDVGDIVPVTLGDIRVWPES